jgi:hypothetical protein
MAVHPSERWPPGFAHRRGILRVGNRPAREGANSFCFGMRCWGLGWSNSDLATLCVNRGMVRFLARRVTWDGPWARVVRKLWFAGMGLTPEWG